MSQNSNQTLEFFCPKCNQRLRAASRLAGQRLVCPKCQQNVKIPGIQNSQNDDAQWLDLEAPGPATQTQSANPKTSDDIDILGGDILSPETPQPKPRSEGKEVAKGSSNAPLKKNTPAASPPVARPESPPKSSTSNSDSGALTSEPDTSPADDELPMLAPESPVSSANVFASDLFASIRLEEAATKPVGSTPAAPKSKSKDVMDAKTESQDSEYRILCRTCGTPQYVPLRKQGKSIRCPDCHSEFVIPPPPPNWNPKAATSKASPKRVDHEVQLAPISGPEVVTPEPTRKSAQEYLNKAEQASIDDHLDNVYSASDFDSREFVRRNVQIFSDLLVWAHLLPLGILTGIAMATLLALGQIFSDKVPPVVFDLIGLLIGGLILGIHFLCGYALVDAGAHRRQQTRFWPLGNLPTLFGEGLPVLAASVLSAAPGVLLGSIAILLGVSTIVSIIPILLSFWILFPITLLSMLNSETISAPFSAKVFSSLGPGREEWGAHYFKTGLVSFIAFLILSVGLTNTVIAVLSGIALPLGLFYLYYQTGLLGSQVAQWLDVDIGHADEESTSEALPR